MQVTSAYGHRRSAVMDSGVPSGPQVVEGAYVALKGAGRAHASRLTDWVGFPGAERIMARVMNLGPELTDKLTHEIPAIEVVHFKAKLLGVADIDWTSFSLPEHATGWQFEGTTLKAYVEALCELGLMTLPSERWREPDEYWPGVHGDFIALNYVSYNRETYMDPADILSRTRRIPKREDGLTFSGSGVATLLDILDNILDHAARATLLAENPRKAVLNAFYLQERNECETVRFGRLNAYTYGINNWPEGREHASQLVVCFNASRKRAKDGEPFFWVEVVPRHEYKEGEVFWVRHGPIIQDK